MTASQMITAHARYRIVDVTPSDEFERPRVRVVVEEPGRLPAPPTPSPKPNTHDIDVLVNIAATGLHRCFDLRSAAFVRAMGRVRARRVERTDRSICVQRLFAAECCRR